MELTDNETRAMQRLYKSSLSHMGGKSLADLLDNFYAWIDISDLMAAGWTRHEAAGTFAALDEKGLIYYVYAEDDEDSCWCLTETGARLADTFTTLYPPRGP